MIRKKLPPPPSIPVTINGSSLTKAKANAVLGIITNEGLTLTLQVEPIIKKMQKNIQQTNSLP